MLEKELAQMKGLLSNINGGNDRDEESPLGQYSPVANKDLSIRIDEIGGMKSGFFSTPITTIDIIPGCLDTSLLGEEDARHLYLQFTQNCLPQYPLMVLHNIDFDTLRLSKPMVLLATVAAASAASEPSLYQKLHTHLVRLITDKVIVNGQRSLELLESILVMEIWLCPPEDLKLLNFYQWIHIAGTMALQLGLFNDPADNDASSDMLLFHGSCNEHTRIALTCYLMCSSAAISLRRQKILPFTPTLASYLETLRQSYEVSDHRLAAWIDLQLIAEQTCDTAKSKSSATQIAFLTQRFDTWRNNLAFGILNESLLMHFHFMRTKTIELAMSFGAHRKYLFPPYLIAGDGHISRTHSTAFAPQDREIEIAHIFIESCHGLLAAFLACDVDSLRSCPTVTFVRAVYACQALLVVDLLLGKNAYSTTERSTWTRQTLDLVQRHLRRVAGEELKRKVPDKICRLLPYLTAALNTAAPSENSQRPGAPKSAHGLWYANVPTITTYSSIQENDATAASDEPPPSRRRKQQSQINPCPYPSNKNTNASTQEFFDLYTTQTSNLTLDFNFNAASTAAAEASSYYDPTSISMSMFDLGFPFSGSEEQMMSGWDLPRL